MELKVPKYYTLVGRKKEDLTSSEREVLTIYLAKACKQIIDLINSPDPIPLKKYMHIGLLLTPSGNKSANPYFIDGYLKIGSDDIMVGTIDVIDSTEKMNAFLDHCNGLKGQGGDVKWDRSEGEFNAHDAIRELGTVDQEVKKFIDEHNNKANQAKGSEDIS